MLIQGMETERQVSLLLQLTRIDSEDVIAAIKDHLVRGATLGNAANIREIPQGNLTRALDNAVAAVVEELNDGPRLRPQDLEMVAEWYQARGHVCEREQALADKLQIR